MPHWGADAHGADMYVVTQVASGSIPFLSTRAQARQPERTPRCKGRRMTALPCWTRRPALLRPRVAHKRARRERQQPWGRVETVLPIFVNKTIFPLLRRTGPKRAARSCILLLLQKGKRISPRSNGRLSQSHSFPSLPLRPPHFHLRQSFPFGACLCVLSDGCHCCFCSFCGPWRQGLGNHRPERRATETYGPSPLFLCPLAFVSSRNLCDPFFLLSFFFEPREKQGINSDVSTSLPSIVQSSAELIAACTPSVFKLSKRILSSRLDDSSVPLHLLSALAGFSCRHGLKEEAALAATY